MCDYDDVPGVWDRKTPRARVKHRCCACDEDIRPGERYVSVGCLYDGAWSRLKYCLRCDLLATQLSIYLGEPVEATLHCDNDPLSPGEAPHLDALAFLSRDEVQALGEGS